MEIASLRYEDCEKYYAFITGTIWADNNPTQDIVNLNDVWHDASEFPNKALPIIIEIDDDIEPSYEVISIDETDEKFWEYLVSDRDITIWAYVKDILPKGGAKWKHLWLHYQRRSQERTFIQGVRHILLIYSPTGWT